MRSIEPRRPLAALAMVNAVAAFGGAIGLATGALALGGNLDDRLPFASPVAGGVALAVIVGLPLTRVAVLAWRGDERADVAAVTTGVVLIGWIVVQLAFLRTLSFFHFFYVAIGALFVWLGRRATTRFTTHIAQLGDVIHDMPAFLTAPTYRRWHLHWGALPAEVGASMPGDEQLPHAQFRATRAITIDAPPDAVWPWLVQVGAGRAGWYSNDLLDNLGRPSATTIVPDLQHLEIGQWVPMSPWGPPSDADAFKVDSFEPEQWMLWTKPDSTWAWRLAPAGHNGTRLTTRVHAVYDWRHPLTAVLGVVLMEFGDFAMQRRMLRGIKSRAEALARQVRLG